MTELFEVVRHPRARRARLTFDPASGRAKLVIPARAALKPALAWAEGKSDWIAEQRARLPQPRPFAPGTTVEVADERLAVDWRPGPRLAVRREGDRLTLEGPPETLPRRVEAWLKRAALDLLERETAEFAGKAGVDVSAVAVADPRGRWGSCSSSGAIRYSWRLILAPGWVRRATVAHEVAHRVHMNHGPAFHALVAELLGDNPAPARAWLRANGARLHWVGRSS
ncbi:M48 family metallopeptidase [Sphingomonas lenta]|uniref:Metal-dependent hydrolase n=1 Tax=Sphingomonas lenta TaxID=1141887 RepID=A0A2A2SE73_9SPHN|nr:SprT family zinc-dependent metalloprotease [Sphingomonas lenta]PAX07513.1 metal-dependent hydrolase [Sphingomonas lenta]